MRGVKLAMSIPILISAVAAGAAAEKPTAPAPQGKGMKVVYLVLLKKGPAWTAREGDARVESRAGSSHGEHSGHVGSQEADHRGAL